MNRADLLLYDNENFNDKKNFTIFMRTIQLLKDSKRFAGQLL